VTAPRVFSVLRCEECGREVVVTPPGSLQAVLCLTGVPGELECWQKALNRARARRDRKPRFFGKGR